MVAPLSALLHPVTGLARQAERVAKAADDLQTRFAAAQNALSADSVSVDPRAAVIPAVEDAMRGAALTPQGDPAPAVADLLQAATAYKAHAAALRVSADVEKAAGDIIAPAKA